MRRTEIEQMAVALSRARGLTDWEKTFAQSIGRELGEGTYLTSKVVRRLEQIYQRRVLEPLAHLTDRRRASEHETRRLQEVWSPMTRERDKAARNGWGR